MPLLPEHVVRKSFSYAGLKRGYDQKQVDAFLDEVVIELRRLHGRVDELEAERMRAASTSLGDETQPPEAQVTRARVQLDEIRAERADLVREIGQLQARYDELAKATLELEARRGN